MTVLLLVVKIGILVSRVRPIGPYGVKLAPCKVTFPPRATLEEVVCNESVPGVEADCDPMPLPKATMISNRPPNKRPNATSRLIQKIMEGVNLPPSPLKAEEGSVCRSGAGLGAYVGAERSGADIASGAGDIASGVGALPGADEAPTFSSFSM